jgi:hypothetical protein
MAKLKYADWPEERKARQREAIKQWKIKNVELVNETARKAYAKWRETNPARIKFTDEELKARKREQNKKYKEANKARNKKWYYANRERERARKKAWRLANPETYKKRAKERSAEYRLRHPGRAKEATAKYRAKHAEHVKKLMHTHHIQRMYKLNATDYAAMVTAQNNRCAICNTDKPGRKNGHHWYIDHCHKTNAVRQLLCHHCNLGLGYFRDNPAFLQQAADYLKRFTRACDA